MSPEDICLSLRSRAGDERGFYRDDFLREVLESAADLIEQQAIAADNAWRNYNEAKERWERDVNARNARIAELEALVEDLYARQDRLEDQECAENIGDADLEEKTQ